ncbi:putative membrane protein [Paenibacillus shirakamiensis]|uniref:Membrane protein n=1 Tax=Paenibacillus shirakamiensis TaxID=1265935 RepID=A0ABS4JIU1_9BACL|nr:general stress protein [Paenibacillus shirakamiensis]MBP2001624.1 putative membrane protein [Paenibacillus shirakamiensis]
MAKKIVGVFSNEQEASVAIEALKGHGFNTEDISVVAKNKQDVQEITNETGTKSPEGIVAGLATGGVVGGTAGLLAGIGALFIPGIGPIVAAGPIVATLTGMVAGAGAGGLVGGLVGLGIPEDEAKEYDTFVDDGRILVLVSASTEEEEQRIYDVFRGHKTMNARHYHELGNTTTPDLDLEDPARTNDNIRPHISATDTGTMPFYNEKVNPSTDGQTKEGITLTNPDLDSEPVQAPDATLEATRMARKNRI